MTREEEIRNKAVKDLCGRLPYGVKLLHTPTNEITNLEMIGNGVIDGDIHDLIENFKPYLFPLSSMTEEQKLELATIKTYVSLNKNKEYLLFDWLNKNHFDYRGLIPMGLAINAVNLNIY